MSSSGGEKGGELDKPGRCLLIPSATGPNCNDVMISLGECFAINQVIDNEEKRGAIKRSFPRHGHGYAHPANEEVRSRNEDIVYGNKYVSTPVMEVTSGKSYSMGTTSKVTDSKQDARRSVGDIITLCGDGHSSDSEVDVSEGEDYENSADEEDIPCYDDDIVPNSLCMFDDSSHRDGSIYRGTLAWKEVYRIADRNETRLEAMTLSDPKDCVYQLGGVCTAHHSGHMFQFFSVKLAKIPMDRGSVELYGYIAVRDRLDPLLNYIVNISRDDPVIMEQGSLIEMSGPKRGIDMYGDALLEYDMRIKIGDREEDDLQLIDGVSVLPDIILRPCNPYTNRLCGDHGALDITRAPIYKAVEATVDVAISEVRSNFDLSLSSFTSGIDKEIQLFRGAIGERRRLRRYVVAVVINTSLHLKFKVGSEEHDCYFKATAHGCSSQHVRTELASISVKVVWSTMPLQIK